ncbi:MAG: PrsW family glutamic-type intramembrane protease [Bryobacteraceae bacterium]|jgi:RsiW-degrading membrane proteinase PrsW (M82 family)
MAEPDEWYYLDNSKTLGPVSAAELARLIKSRSLSPSTQVAQAGWPKWMDASQALASQLARQDLSLDSASTRRAYAIKVRCVSGPDAGKAFMIGASELSLGRVAGIGQNDPQVAENHVVLSWQDNTLHYRTLGGAKLKVAGVESTQGALSNGQTFGLGASTWQVGTAPVELASLLSSLAARLNKLATPEKLEGFSLKTMFSEVFKARKPGEVEDYFSVGTAKTTPPLEEVQTGWPKPWFFMRVLIFMLALYLVMSKTIDWFGNPRMVPGLMVIGSFAVPLATLVLFWELNTPRNVSFVQVLMLVCLGGVISLFVTHLVGDIASLGWLGHASAGIEEEVAKLLAVVLVVSNTRYKYILNGIVFGAAIACGFAALETAGYSLYNGFLRDFLRFLLAHLDILAKVDSSNLNSLNAVIDAASQRGYTSMFGVIEFRSYLAPFGHIAWTAIAAGALWQVKGGKPFHIKMLANETFLKKFSVPVLLHTVWDAPILDFNGALFYAKYVGLGVIAWYMAFVLVQQGLRQIRAAQLVQAETDLAQTREILSTTSRLDALDLAH